MAGRPKTMAKKLAAIEEAAFQLNANVSKLCPPQYRLAACESEDESEDDLRPAAWREALQATEAAARAMNYLLGVAEDSAGLDFDALDAERDARRGLLQLPAEVEAGCGGEPNTA